MTWPKEFVVYILFPQDGNIFNPMEIAARTLKENSMKEESAEMPPSVMDSGSYDNALCIIGKDVNITSVDEDENEDFDEYEEYGGLNLQ